MSSIVSYISSFISSYIPVGSNQQTYQSSVSHLSSRDREELTRDISSNINHEEVESSLAELDITLAECMSSLKEFDKKERFLGTRIDSYKMLMEQREELMNTLRQTISNNNHDTNKGGSELDEMESINVNANDTRERLDTLQTKHAADEQSLQDVKELHKTIIAEIETLRRRIDDLEVKKESILQKREECQDFLMATEEHNHLVSLEDLEGMHLTESHNTST